MKKNKILGSVVYALSQVLLFFLVTNFISIDLLGFVSYPENELIVRLINSFFLIIISTFIVPVVFIFQLVLSIVFKLTAKSNKYFRQLLLFIFQLLAFPSRYVFVVFSELVFSTIGIYFFSEVVTFILLFLLSEVIANYYYKRTDGSYSPWNRTGVDSIILFVSSIASTVILLFMAVILALIRVKLGV